jgi:hypothetical protein
MRYVTEQAMRAAAPAASPPQPHASARGVFMFGQQSPWPPSVMGQWAVALLSLCWLLASIACLSCHCSHWRRPPRGKGYGPVRGYLSKEPHAAPHAAPRAAPRADPLDHLVHHHNKFAQVKNPYDLRTLEDDDYFK